jgi:hypothetical protein
VKTLNEAFSSRSSWRRYEAWFIRLGLADSSGAWWLRYLLMNPGRAGCPRDRRKSVGMMTVPKIFRQPLQVIHVFREILGDMWLQNLENAALATSARRVSPGEADHRAHTGFREDGRFDLTAKVFRRGSRSCSMMERMSSGFTSRIPFSSRASALRRAGRRF